MAKRRGNPNWNGYKKKQAIVPGSKMVRVANPSTQQVAIFDFVCDASNKKNLVVDAKAGTGKTTTCSEGMWRDESCSVTRVGYFVFANRNAREAEAKCRPGVNVRTCHSHGFKACLGRGGVKTVLVDPKKEEAKGLVIARALVGADDDKDELRDNLQKAMSLAKGYLCENPEDVEPILAKHDVDTGGMDVDEFCAHVIKGLGMAKDQDRRIDFDDMIWLPIVLNLQISQFDKVYIDEAQDLNKARLELMMRSIATGGRVIAVGDPRQAIFGFTGAQEDSIGQIIERTNATILPLNVTYRCGKKIVELAQTIVPEYAAYEGNCDGNVEDSTEQNMIKNALPGDFILSRTNAPLVGYCLQFLKEGRKANIQGRDMGRSLIWMIKRSEAKDVNTFLDWLSAWASTECERLTKKKRDCSFITDKAEVLEAFADGCKTIDEMLKRIQEMFADNDTETDRIILSTIHKSKGLERNRVWLLRNTIKPEKGGEEANIAYVGYTRAIRDLFLVR